MRGTHVHVLDSVCLSAANIQFYQLLRRRFTDSPLFAQSEREALTQTDGQTDKQTHWLRFGTAKVLVI